MGLRGVSVLVYYKPMVWQIISLSVWYCNHLCIGAKEFHTEDEMFILQGPPGLAVPQLGGPPVVTPTTLATPPQPLPASVTAVTAPFAAAAGNPMQNPQNLIPATMSPSGMPMTPNAAASLLTPLRPGMPGLGLPVMPPPIMTTNAGENIRRWWCVLCSCALLLLLCAPA